jgi:CheY-like chemotaxis protein
MNSECSILLVEDNDNDAFFFERAVRGLGFNGDIVVKASIQDAWRFLTGTPATVPVPNLIVSDNMPGQVEGGMNLLDCVRVHPQYREIPFILFTGGIAPAEAERAIRRGAIVIVKPVFSEMTKALRPALEMLPPWCRPWLK